MRFSLLYFCCFINIVFIWGQAQQTVGLFQNEDLASDAYTLFSNNQTIYLIDQCGFVVNTWESDFDPGLSSYLLKNGTLLRTAKIDGFFNGSGIAGQFELFDWEGALIWNFEYLADNIQAHHDIEPLPNGNFLAIVWERISEAEAKQNGRKYDGEVWSEKVIEIEMIGNQRANIVWEWRLWDHLIQDYDATKSNFGTVAEHPGLVDLNYIGQGQISNGDWVHFNAIAYNPELDQIALSARHISEIWIIDHSTTTAEAKTSTGGNANRGGDLLYRYGNPQVYQRGTASDQRFFKQHDVRWAPEDSPFAGHLMVFNNRKTDTTSSIEIWNPPLNSDSSYDLRSQSAYGPASVAWEYTSPDFYSSILSGAHFLPNGNLFITEGINGRFFEITAEREKVWEYLNPSGRTGAITVQGEATHRNDVFRATKYPIDYSAFSGKDMSSGIPIEWDPLESDCDTSRSSFVPSVIELEVVLLQNPVQEVLSLNANFSDRNIQLVLTDIAGRQLVEQSLEVGKNEVPVAHLASGIYFLRVIAQGQLYEVYKILKV